MDDLLLFQDEAGNEIALYMLERFKVNGKEYALLATPEEGEDGGIYVMRLEEKDDEFSFAMPDDEEMEAVTPTLMEILDHMGGGCTHDCCSCHGCHGGEDDDCDCDDDHCCDEHCSCHDHG